MSLNKDMIESLSVEDIEKISKYKELIDEAKEACKIIKSAYKFDIGESIKCLWSDTHNAEYLLHSGVWQARYLNQSYDVIISVDDIFRVYKAEFEERNHRSIKRNIDAESAPYFRSFVYKAKKMIEKE